MKICAKKIMFSVVLVSGLSNLGLSQDGLIIEDAENDASGQVLPSEESSASSVGDLPGGLPAEACPAVENPGCALIFNGFSCNLGTVEGENAFNPGGFQSCAYLESCDGFAGTYYEKDVDGQWIEKKTCPLKNPTQEV